MSRFGKYICFALILGVGVLFLAIPTADCQLNSGASTVGLTATLPESLTISATPSAVTFTLVPNATATGSAPVVITTTWALATTRTTGITLTAWFASATKALSGSASSPDYIPTSAVFGEDPQGIPTTYTAFTQNPFSGTGAAGVAGASLQLWQSAALTNANRGGTRTDNLSLEINLAGQTLQADTYTGTLNIQAQAN